MPLPREPANIDDVSIQQSLLSDSLKDLINLRKQLYSAAEYFELSYNDEEQKQILGNSLKDYAIKALVSTVDHLGSVTYKVNDLFDENVEEVTETELRVSCIEQRLQTCREHIDQEGLSQQSSVINIPKYHKRYILPVGDTADTTNHLKLNFQKCSLDDDDHDWHQNKNAVRAPIGESPPSAARKGCSPLPSPHLQHTRRFSFSGTMPKKERDRRTVSPHRFPLILRTASIGSRSSTPKSSRSSTPNPSRPTTPNPSRGRRQYPEEPRKSASMRLHVDSTNTRDTTQSISKGKRLLKALLSRRKSRKDDTLYTYLDEY